MSLSFPSPQEKAFTSIPCDLSSQQDVDLEVGIICPYAAQARLLRQLVADQGLTGRVMVGTIHGLQGDENDVIIVDLVDGKPFYAGFPLYRVQGLALAERRPHTGQRKTHLHK